MQLKYFKTIIPAAALALSMSVSSCVGDLDATPIDPNVSTDFVQDEVFAKIYATMALTGQQGPAGNGDVDDIDEGTSGFYRLIWNFSELPTDEAICSWGDVGIPELNFARWSSSHEQLTGLYCRLYFDITLCNHFLEKTEGMGDEKSVKQRAEARFMRALNYFYLLDFFGNVPFTEKVASEPPQQIKRADLYAYIEKELKEIEADMYEPRQAPFGRADKAANWLLLSRLYLNAEVYTGKAQWSAAAEYAKKVMDSAYELADEYKELFMGDNDQNEDAMKEIILPIRQHGVNTQSYAGASFLIASTHTSGMGSWGTSEGWGGNRGRQALAKKFFADGIIPANSTDPENTAALAGDDRALFVTYGTYKNDKGELKEFITKLPISNWNTFAEGVAVGKFTNSYSNGGTPSNSVYVDMDIPFMRAAEAYLTYAEATLRAGGSKDDAKAAVNALRDRANTSRLTDLSLNDILDEKCREFYFETQRRTDLIRYGYFTAGSYLWDWKGEAPEGMGISAIYNLLPIPASDLNANENLVQNPGY